VEEFVRQFSAAHKMPVAGVEDEFVRALESHSWPGNVRELQNTIERAVIMSHSPTLALRDLPKDFVVPEGPSQEGVLVRPGVTFKVVEDELLAQTLAHNGGNKKAKRDMLGISRRGIYNRIDRFEGELTSGRLNGQRPVQCNFQLTLLPAC
jgi:DNA-binding NtrC family response regulator